MKALFESQGVDTKSSTDFKINGKEAYEHIMEAYDNDISYDLIFMDFSMPIMNGIEATLNIRSFLTNIKKIKREF